MSSLIHTRARAYGITGPGCAVMGNLIDTHTVDLGDNQPPLFDSNPAPVHQPSFTPSLSARVRFPGAHNAFRRFAGSDDITGDLAPISSHTRPSYGVDQDKDDTSSSFLPLLLVCLSC